MDSITLPTSFDISKLSYGEPKKNDSGGSSIYVKYNGAPLTIQTAPLTSQFGLSKWPQDKGGAQATEKEKHTLELSFKNMVTKKSAEAMYNMLSNMDKKFIEDGTTNSLAWLKKSYKTTDVVEALYYPMVKHSRDKETGEVTDKYPPSFRINVPFGDGHVSCDVYNNEKQAMKLTDIERGSTVSAIIQCLGIWIAGGKFGCSWKVLQLKVVPPQTIKGFAFQTLEEDDEKGTDVVDEVVDDPEPEVEAVNKKRQPEPEPELIESSDAGEDEDGDEEDDDPPPPPPKKVLKKPVLKK